jgi:hypothetical protein
VSADSGCCHEGASINRFPGWVVPDCTGPSRKAGRGRATRKLKSERRTA